MTVKWLMVFLAGLLIFAYLFDGLIEEFKNSSEELDHWEDD